MEHLGYTSPSMTLGVYASVTQGARGEARKLKTRLFGSAAEPAQEPGQKLEASVTA